MANYYEVLELTPQADATQIRGAYKRLAMRWHPDRNPNNKEAEERFKIINEAYHVLSDPLKKARYDARINSFETEYTTAQAEALWREAQRKRYAQWQAAQRKQYTIDNSYFKVQGLAFLTFLVMAGICFGIIHTASYVVSQKRYAHWKQNRALVEEVNGLFASGRFDDALSKIILLHKQEPLELQFSSARDSLVETLREKAEANFTARNFEEALFYLEPLRKYEFPPRAETLRKISICQYSLGEYTQALTSLKQLLSQQPWNIELVYHIGIINLNYLNKKEEALYYFDMGKKIFKENLTEIYGPAFEVVMNPADVPDIYYDIFLAKGAANLALENYKEAIKDFNWAVYLRPQRGEPYKMRAIAKTSSNNFFMVCDDLANAKRFGAEEVERLQRKYCR